MQQKRRDVGQATDSAHNATGDTGTGNRNQTTCNGMRACSRHMQRAPGKMQQTTRSVQHTTSRQQYAANNNDVQRARQHATRSMQRTTENVEKTSDGAQRTTDNKATRQQGNLRNAAYTAPKTANNGGKRTKSEGLRTSGLCRDRWLRWTLGGGLAARLVRRLRAPLTSCLRRLRRADSRSSLRRLPDVSVSPCLPLCLAGLGHRISRGRVPPYPNAQFCELHDSTVTALIPLHHRRRSVTRGARESGFRSSHLVHCIACCVLSVPFVFGACCGTGRVLHLVCGVCAVLRTGCRVQIYAHTAGCPLPAARRTRNAAVPCVSCCTSHVLASSCMPSAVWCTLFVACCPLPVVCCRPHVALLSLALLHVCCPVHAVCYFFRVVDTKSGFCCMLHVARCPVHVVCCVACRCCSLHVA
jgi:hypothetical protein